MYQPRFTTDPKRLARLQSNYEEGKLREQLPYSVREVLDQKALQVSQDDLLKLFENATQQNLLAREARRQETNSIIAQYNPQQRK
mmetsp:Transcript_20640/g.23852  ORF Transcript_20640/g.23852 Transcript_20640/m.23852 type:complete len:85 (+) Transcript_20640:47-301(+)|eukprot:CAMPEP_0176433094 /NCGR_PEP_ID=MMETSP0127-20121128/15799_1 /TAXON_ID=938130 /ORGANISM="Platyophrya macrostoma, Strain WH" /LENGTH=84 /DNA_ID=CAMNT_0017815419 /DNA_START=46 /DNA_END=300 /DNA_ORIENTATION=-